MRMYLSSTLALNTAKNSEWTAGSYSVTGRGVSASHIPKSLWMRCRRSRRSRVRRWRRRRRRRSLRGCSLLQAEQLPSCLAFWGGSAHSCADGSPARACFGITFEADKGFVFLRRPWSWDGANRTFRWWWFWCRDRSRLGGWIGDCPWVREVRRWSGRRRCCWVMAGGVVGVRWVTPGSWCFWSAWCRSGVCCFGCSWWCWSVGSGVDAVVFWWKCGATMSKLTFQAFNVCEDAAM